MQSGSCKMAALGAQKACAPRAATGAASGAAARNQSAHNGLASKFGTNTL